MPARYIEIRYQLIRSGNPGGLEHRLIRFRSPISWLALLMLLILSGAPARAETCGMGNTCPEVDGLVLNPGILAPGQTGQVTATAHDPDGALTRYDFSATDGIFPGGLATETIMTSNTLVVIDWTAPMTPGPYFITVKVWDNGGFMGIPTSGTVSEMTIPVDVSISNQAPIIDSLTADRTQIFLDETANLTAVAHDPDSDPFTYSWSTNYGTVTPGAPGTAVFQAPSTPGIATITCTVQDDGGAQSSALLVISVCSLVADSTITTGLATPQRVSSDSFGYLYVADRSAGGIVVLTAAGDFVKLIPLREVTGIVVDWQDRLLVGTLTGARILDRDGNLLNTLASPSGLSRVQDVAVDDLNLRYAVLYQKVGRISVFDGAGSHLLTFGANGDGPGLFRGASCIAINGSGEIHVGDTGQGLVHVFDAAGEFLRSFGGRGSDPGQFLQLQGLAVDGTGAVYGCDAFQSRVLVFDAAGTLREILGTYGTALGQFQTPTGLTVMDAFDKLVITSLNASALQVYDMQGAVTPPTNTPPTLPVPIDPAMGTIFPTASTVYLEVLNATDPDFQSLTYDFELYLDTGGPLTLLNSWTVPEGAGTTQVDASADASASGDYVWRVRAFDGIAASGWTADQTFQVTSSVNGPPSAVTVQSPVGAAEVAETQPLLTVLNATDPDGDTLTYLYEVALVIDGSTVTVAASPEITEDGAGTTAWQIPAGVLELSQEAHWRCRATDGFAYGAWSAYETFWTPPFPVPEASEVGHLPADDRTRPGEVRYEIDPQSADTTVYFQVYDVTSALDLEMEVNGSWTAFVPAQTADDWSFTVSVTIPAIELDDVNPNRIRFLHPDLVDEWGIRNVALTAPAVPLIAAAGWNTVIDVTWDPPPVSPATRVLRIFRSLWSGGPFSAIADADPAAGICRDTGLSNGTVYYYKAVYVDDLEAESEPSPVVSAVPTDAFGPTPITDLMVVKSGSDALLRWTPVTSSPAVQYIEVYRDVFGTWDEDTAAQTNMISTAPALADSETVVNDLLPGPDVWYSVIPLDADGVRAVP